LGLIGATEKQKKQFVLLGQVASIGNCFSGCEGRLACFENGGLADGKEPTACWRSERPGIEGIALRLFYDAAAALGDC